MKKTLEIPKDSSKLIINIANMFNELIEDGYSIQDIIVDYMRDPFNFFNDLIYYGELNQFYNKHKKDLLDYLINLEKNTGENSIKYIFDSHITRKEETPQLSDILNLETDFLHVFIKFIIYDILLKLLKYNIKEE